MDKFVPKPQALEKANTFLRIYHKIALQKYPNFIDQLPLFNAKPTYDPPIIHFSPARGGFDDDFLESATDSTLAKTARDWLGSEVKKAIPPQLLDDIVNGDCIIFLGAGASTEGLSDRPSLANIIANKCGYPKNQPYSLPLISQYFCDSLDGGAEKSPRPIDS